MLFFRIIILSTQVKESGFYHLKFKENHLKKDKNKVVSFMKCCWSFLVDISVLLILSMRNFSIK